MWWLELQKLVIPNILACWAGTYRIFLLSQDIRHWMGALLNFFKSRECETFGPAEKGRVTHLSLWIGRLPLCSFPLPTSSSKTSPSVCTQKWGFVAVKRFPGGRGSCPSRAGFQLSMVTPNCPPPHPLLVHRDDSNPTSAVTLKKKKASSPALRKNLS